jgi:hypothetical protein
MRALYFGKQEQRPTKCDIEKGKSDFPHRSAIFNQIDLEKFLKLQYKENGCIWLRNIASKILVKRLKKRLKCYVERFEVWIKDTAKQELSPVWY